MAPIKIDPKPEKITVKKECRYCQCYDEIESLCYINGPKGEYKNIEYYCDEFIIRAGFKLDKNESKKTQKLEIIKENETVDESIKKEAIRIIENENVVRYLADTVKRIVVGNRLAIELTILICIQKSLVNGQGVYIHVNGDSGGGKSYTIRQVLWIMPPEMIEDGSLSAKALFYANETQSKIYYIDDFNTLDENVKSTIKNVLTNFRRPTYHTTVNKIGGEMKNQKNAVPARTVIIFSSVDSIDDQQVMNRMIPLPIDTDTNIKKGVHQFQNLQASGIIDDLDAVVDERVQVCREIIRLLTAKMQYVIIPFANEIMWDEKEMANIRNYNVFLDLIKLSAIMEQRKRSYDEKNRLIATYEDFHNAVRIYAPRREMQATKLSSGPQKLLDFLMKNHTSNYTQAELVSELKSSQASISRWIMILKEMSHVVEDTNIREILQVSKDNKPMYDSMGNLMYKVISTKVYKYNGDMVKSSIFDHPLQLTDEERAKTEYIKFLETKV